jgi:phosphoglycerol transferase MdoB-like AlkP superfamily enzyme
LNTKLFKSKRSSSDLILLLLLIRTHALLKNSSVLCLCFLTVPLVGVCAWWKCWGARYLSKNTANTIYEKTFFSELHLVRWRFRITNEWNIVPNIIVLGLSVTHFLAIINVQEPRQWWLLSLKAKLRGKEFTQLTYIT